MINLIHRRALIAVLCIVFVACKKEAAPVTPPVPPTPINEVIETEPAILTPVVKKVNDVNYGFYSAVPANYSKTTKKYPVIIFIPGGGQIGRTEADLALLLNDGMAKLLFEKKFPPNFKVKDKNYSFIVLTPQFSQVPTTSEVMDFVTYAKNNYRIDPSRIYLSGLSMGGVAVSNLGAIDPAQFAAVVPIAGVFTEEVPKKSEKIAKGNLPVWVFHNDGDPTVPLAAPEYFISEVLKFKPSIQPKLTIFKMYGHNAWDQAIHPDYKEDGMNIYEWMLQYSR